MRSSTVHLDDLYVLKGTLKFLVLLQESIRVTYRTCSYLIYSSTSSEYIDISSSASCVSWGNVAKVRQRTTYIVSWSSRCQRLTIEATGLAPCCLREDGGGGGGTVSLGEKEDWSFVGHLFCFSYL